jgi:hypothetical protein
MGQGISSVMRTSPRKTKGAQKTICCIEANVLVERMSTFLTSVNNVQQHYDIFKSIFLFVITLSELVIKDLLDKGVLYQFAQANKFKMN